MKKLILLALIAFGSASYAQTLERVTDAEDLSSKTSTCGYQLGSVVYNYKRYLKYIKADGTHTYYEFDGNTYTEFTAGGNLPSFTVSGSGILAFYNDIHNPNNLYLKCLDDNGVKTFYKWDGSNLTSYANPAELSDGPTGWYLGTINDEIYTFGSNGTDNVLFKQNGSSFETIPTPNGYEGYGGIVHSAGTVNDVDNVLYLVFANGSGKNSLFIYDGEKYTAVPTPDGYNGFPNWKVDRLSNRVLFLSYEKTEDGIFDPFMFDLETETLSPISGVTRSTIANSGASMYPSGFTLNGEFYFVFNKTASNNTIYKLDIDAHSATEIVGADTEGYTSVWPKFHIAGQKALISLTNGGYNSLALFDGTTLSFPTMPTLGGLSQWKTIRFASNDNFGTERVYFSMSNQNVLETAKGVRLLYSYDITTNTITSSPMELNDGVVFAKNKGADARASFMIGEDIYHGFLNSGAANLLYKEEDICTTQINETAIDTAVTAASFIVPSGSYEVSTEGLHNDTITTVSGCDSVITLNVTFVAPPTITGLSIVESASSTASEVTDHIFVENDVIYVKVSYSDEVVVSNLLNANPSVAITSLGKELIYHSYEGSDVFFSYTVTDEEDENSVITLADEITLNGGEILNKNLDNAASLDISEVNSLSPNVLTSSQGALSSLEKVIHPNPFSEELKINLHDLTNVHIKIYDTNGMLIKEAVNVSNINTADLANGMYILYLESDETSDYIKLIKN